METLSTPSFFVLATAGTGFVFAYSVVIGYLMARPIKFLASILF